MRMRELAVVGLAALGSVGIAAAENWPQFRGPTGAGVVNEQKVPAEWGNEKNIAWKVEIPGAAWSQPVVWGDKIYVTTAITENQTKPKAGSGFGGFGGGGFGRPGGGRPGGPGGGFPPMGVEVAEVEIADGVEIHGSLIQWISPFSK